MPPKVVQLDADDVDTSPRRSSPQRGAERPLVPSASFVPMQFRMPADFAQEFRIEAVRRNMKYNELLKAAFQHYARAVPIAESNGQ